LDIVAPVTNVPVCVEPSPNIVRSHSTVSRSSPTALPLKPGAQRSVNLAGAASKPTPQTGNGSAVNVGGGAKGQARQYCRGVLAGRLQDRGQRLEVVVQVGCTRMTVGRAHGRVSGQPTETGPREPGNPGAGGG
jgi:hypothetical protein